MRVGWRLKGYGKSLKTERQGTSLKRTLECVWRLNRLTLFLMMALLTLRQSYDSDSDSDKGYKNKKVSKKSYVRNKCPKSTVACIHG